jgi:hypothetical protein
MDKEAEKAFNDPTKSKTQLDLGGLTQDPKTPRMKVSKWGCDEQLLIVDDYNEKLGATLLMKAVGMGDLDFFKGILKQLAERGSGRTIDQDELNFMLAVIKGIEPRNVIENMLAAQMARVHVGAMEEQDSRALAKLTRTFADLVEVLERLRAGAQTVTHVSVNDNAQALIGNVTLPSRDNALDTSATLPPAISDAKTAPMAMEERKEPGAVLRRYRPHS